MEEIKIEKIVHGGQGLGTLADGRKIFVWNALPGETVSVRITKKKKGYLEGIAESITEASKERIAPKEDNYLATSPWQMMTFAAENKYKKTIVDELFAREKVDLPEYDAVIHNTQEERYRNKMEYSFWGDDNGLHLAMYRRGTHGKQIIQGSLLAMPAIDEAAASVLAELQKHHVRAGSLKTVIVRCTQDGKSVASLFVKTEEFPEIALPAGLQGLRVYYSTPKSPASVSTRLLYQHGDVVVRDTLLNNTFSYDVDSFFQVNIPIFEQALASIKQHIQADNIVDMYAGTGSIGLSVAACQVQLVELDPSSAAMARINANAASVDAEVVEASTEKALEYIVSDTPIIFDPPRSGLHHKVVERVLGVCPPKIVYLSCNPATQARDLALLQEKYTITHFEVYNFFPRTPHIETLAVLERQ